MRYRKLKRGGDDALTELISSAPGEANTRLEKRDEFLFVEHWKEGETPFTWRKRWETLPLEILSTGDTGNNTAAAADDPRATSKMVVPLNAKCSSRQAKKSIRLIEEGTSYLSLNVFSDFDVTVNAIDENHRMGSIFHIDNARARDADRQDYIGLSCTVPLSWLESILAAVRNAGGASSVGLDFNIHCFAKEYERYSVDPGLHEKYSLERGGTGYAFLADYRIG